jgi:hypothetical protein
VVGNAASHTAQPLRSLALTQVIFFVLIAWCVMIDHSHTAQLDGISFYGVFHRTLVQLGLAFVVASWGLWRAAGHLVALGAPALVAFGVRVVALSLYVVIATPFNQGPLLNWTHMSVGVAMALVQGAITVWLLARTRRALAVVAFVVQLTGGLVAFASLPDWNFPYLLEGEIVYQVGFALALVVWMLEVSAAPLGAHHGVGDHVQGA